MLNSRGIIQAVGVLATSAGVCVTAVGVFTKVSPEPGVYVRMQYGQDHLYRKLRPQVEVKFGNVGLGPMFLRNLEVALVRGKEKEVVDVREVVSILQDDDIRVAVSDTLFSEYRDERAWSTGKHIPLLSLLPTKEKEFAMKGNFEAEREWAERASAKLKDLHPSLNVKYSWLLRKIPFTSTERKLSVFVEKKVVGEDN